MKKRRPLWRLFFCAAFAVFSAAGASAADYDGFAIPKRVVIRGYDHDAMEPFITKDGRYLFFNNRNDPATDTNLRHAERLDDLTFIYRGEITGANGKALDAVASMDRNGELYFVSTRSYADTLSTIYRARFSDGHVTMPEIAPGISRLKPGVVNFDAEISADGRAIFFVDGKFDGGPVPASADIVMATGDGDTFQRSPASDALLANVNTGALEYAPDISTNLLELFFTRMKPGWAAPEIFRSARASIDAPFGTPEKVGGIDGFVEAPSLSGDGRLLYFHKLENGRFVIYCAARK